MDKQNSDDVTSEQKRIGTGAEVQGLSLRDYFAAKALQGWIANPTANSGLPETATSVELAQVGAVLAYLAADAMLEERLRPGYMYEMQKDQS